MTQSNGLPATLHGAPLLTFTVMYAVLIMFFTYFYTVFAEHPSAYGKYAEVWRLHPGIRPGQPTALYIDRIMTRITSPVPSS